MIIIFEKPLIQERYSMLKKLHMKLCILLLVFGSFSSGFTEDEEGIKYLEKMSKAFTHIGKKAIPAAVYIKAEYKVDTSQGNAPFDSFHEEFFRRFFGQSEQQKPQPKIHGGSGFIARSDGYIVTNNHVVKDSSKITVILNTGKEYTATLLGADPRTDLAIIKIDEKNLPFLEFGDSEDLEIMEWVFAIGNPFALESTVTHGIVSAKGRQDLGITALENYIQTDAPINPGNSGGPLINLRGKVIGVNTAIFTQSGGSMGIGFAIPSNMVKQVMDQIISTGVVKRAYLGIILQNLDKDLSEALNLKSSEGILISDVVKDSPADKAGLKQGDIIIEINGEKIKNGSQFRNQIALKDPGTVVSLGVLRNNTQKTFKVTLGTLTEDEVSSTEFTNKLGIEIENLTPDLAKKIGQSPDIEGVVISKVRPGSPADQAGLKPYFLITAIIKGLDTVEKISNTSDFNESMKKQNDKKTLVLLVRYQNYQRYYTIKMP